MSAQNETIYVKADRNTICNTKDIKIGDVVDVFCADKNIQSTIRAKHLYTFQEREIKKNQARKVCSLLKIVGLILENYPNASVENLGEQDFVIIYEGNPKKHMVWQWVKTIFTSIAIFFGSAFTIMTFNNDVSVPEVFEKIYAITMGKASSGYTILEICYSVGLAVGILVYFNHIGHKKITPDPTPIQVQMRKYENDVDTTFIDESERKGSNLDVS